MLAQQFKRLSRLAQDNPVMRKVMDSVFGGAAQSQDENRATAAGNALRYGERQISTSGEDSEALHARSAPVGV